MPILIKMIGCYLPIPFSAADYIYYDGEIKDYFEYGDLGILLGQAIKNCEYLKKVNVVKSM
ncbi:ethanolamine ammonia-lyase reactivating factor EutA, partial [Clostridioides difficile]